MVDVRVVEMSKRRCTKFCTSVLQEVDCNQDRIGLWCKQGFQDTEALCTFCNVTISCAQHGATAVKRHAASKRHLDVIAKHRDTSGILRPPKDLQTTIDFSEGKLQVSLQDQVCQAEAIFVMSVVSKGIPYSWADTATEIQKKMFPDSTIAKNFNCARNKLSYVVSDGLGPYFKSRLLTELCRPDVFFPS